MCDLPGQAWIAFATGSGVSARCEGRAFGCRCDYSAMLRSLGGRTAAGWSSRAATPAWSGDGSGNVELTFLGDPFEGLGRTLDPILAVVSVGRQQLDHLIGAAGGRARHVAGGKIDGLS